MGPGRGGVPGSAAGQSPARGRAGPLGAGAALPEQDRRGAGTGPAGGRPGPAQRRGPDRPGAGARLGRQSGPGDHRGEAGRRAGPEERRGGGHPGRGLHRQVPPARGGGDPGPGGVARQGQPGGLAGARLPAREQVRLPGRRGRLPQGDGAGAQPLVPVPQPRPRPACAQALR